MADSDFDRRHVLLDDLDLHPAVNRLHCSCGAEIHPACDISLASIRGAFDAHLRHVGAATSRPAPDLHTGARLNPGDRLVAMPDGATFVAVDTPGPPADGARVHAGELRPTGGAL